MSGARRTRRREPPGGPVEREAQAMLQRNPECPPMLSLADFGLDPRAKVDDAPAVKAWRAGCAMMDEQPSGAAKLFARERKQHRRRHARSARDRGSGRDRARGQSNVERPRTDEQAKSAEGREQPTIEPQVESAPAPVVDAPDTTTPKTQTEDPTKLEDTGDEG